MQAAPLGALLFPPPLRRGNKGVGHFMPKPLQDSCNDKSEARNRERLWEYFQIVLLGIYLKTKEKTWKLKLWTTTEKNKTY